MREGDLRPSSPRINRRTFLGAGLGAALLLPSCASPPVSSRPMSGMDEPFDREVLAFMKKRGIPGGALAVVKDRRLVCARGYGWADREKRIPAGPKSLFRIASISKPITA